MSCNPPVPTFPGLEVGPVWIRAGANPVGCVSGGSGGGGTAGRSGSELGGPGDGLAEA